jgi:hypothetical protein
MHFQAGVALGPGEISIMCFGPLEMSWTVQAKDSKGFEMHCTINTQITFQMFILPCSHKYTT